VRSRFRAAAQHDIAGSFCPRMVLISPEIRKSAAERLGDDLKRGNRRTGAASAIVARSNEPGRDLFPPIRPASLRGHLMPAPPSQKFGRQFESLPSQGRTRHAGWPSRSDLRQAAPSFVRPRAASQQAFSDLSCSQSQCRSGVGSLPLAAVAGRC
jgi:hypothetical protein